MNAQEPLPNHIIKQQQEVDSCVYFHIFCLYWTDQNLPKIPPGFFYVTANLCFLCSFLWRKVKKNSCSKTFEIAQHSKYKVDSCEINTSQSKTRT